MAPQNAVSLVGRAGELSPGKTYKLMRALRKHALNYLGQLWMLTSDRRHAKDVAVLMTELKADWCRVQKLLGRSRDKAGSFIPVGLLCSDVRPMSSPASWPGGPSSLSCASVTAPSAPSKATSPVSAPPPKPARPASATPTLRTAPETQTRLRSPPAPALPARTTTPAPLSHGD